MLRLENITKVYKTGNLETKALKGITIAFRKNEFVSILGPSGCGKTTTLNIIGGLDHYTSGNLSLMGRPTKEFKDHDWDVYRNHHIGFIFQSYNLIPQENIEENVELALTIAGLSKEERKAKARKALDRVGLAGMYEKRPNQLSGGQSQRVAIARALVNEPDILLADEPTGALDSVTSVQIMDLIKEISKEKLVIMVTHNPDLAQRYSTRIVNLKDGEIVGDSNPYSLEDEKKEYEHQQVKTEAELSREKAKMSWWTAFKLSAKNLVAKIKRTSLVVVAASIGIVGVSAVMAVSSGVTGYIEGTEDDMLSGNPVYIAKSSIDLNGMMNAVSGNTQRKIVADGVHDGKIDIDFMVDQLASLSKTMVSNDISEDYVRYVEQMPSSYYKSLEKSYGINVFNNLFTDDRIRFSKDSGKVENDGDEADVTYSLTAIEGYAQAILENANDGKYAAYSSLISSLNSVVSQTLDNKDYVLSQYDLADGGRYPEKEDEMVLVLNHDQKTTDIMMTMLGYYDQADFETVLDYYGKKNDENSSGISAGLEEKKARLNSIDMEKIKSKTFYYYPNDVVFTKNNDPFTSQSSPFTYSYDASSFSSENKEKGMSMKIVGILAPKQGTTYGSLSTGLYYTSAFTRRMLSDGKDSEIVKYFPTYRQNMKTMAELMGQDATEVTSYISMPSMNSGILYNLPFYYAGSGEVKSGTKTLGVGSSTLLSSVSVYTLSLDDLGAATLPTRIRVYPNNFGTKYQVTDYLDKWNDKEEDITLAAVYDDNGQLLQAEKTLSGSSRSEVKYNDDLQVVITMINGIINIVTIALVAFTSLSLVVSTVMIGIITYVSVMERIKEIGIIRAIGGRKKDVRHLFNAETFIIGLASGLFGILLTYIFEIIMNATVGVKYSIGMIANLHWETALIVVLVSVALTMIAGLIPASSAARKDPVEALRTE